MPLLFTQISKLHKYCLTIQIPGSTYEISYTNVTPCAKSWHFPKNLEVF